MKILYVINFFFIKHDVMKKQKNLNIYRLKKLVIGLWKICLTKYNDFCISMLFSLISNVKTSIRYAVVQNWGLDNQRKLATVCVQAEPIFIVVQDFFFISNWLCKPRTSELSPLLHPVTSTVKRDPLSNLRSHIFGSLCDITSHCNKTVVMITMQI